MTTATLTPSARPSTRFLTPIRQLLAHWLSAQFAASAPRALTAFEEAEQVRAMAVGLMNDDPAFAADLFAAADRHEFGAQA
ncbi:hypothetical protein D8B23_13090 [Verminephrobacter aporrectodeae subsp. tuberculatae]|uniref:hypothetical protein n=1 Tax=Verminephrobacter aporrectodeae TaxID=1110389 RepID=UPI002243E3C8|nr:hypothetical protein [Verminephrobacter aporrectodeae]MCW8199332.1 hypothetical protein [Verminephrobacter aporrectodeae subsp. tuberculatae]